MASTPGDSRDRYQADADLLAIDLSTYMLLLEAATEAAEILGRNCQSSRVRQS